MLPYENIGPSTYPFEEGTVLYSKLRPYLNKVVVADAPGVATTELVPLLCDRTKLLPQYLAHYLRSPEFLNFANTVVAGAKMPRMVMSEFWAYKVPVPPLAEQCRIAALLNQAAALCAKRAETVARLDGLAQSIFTEMFGDPRANDRQWTRGKIGECISDMRGGAALEPDDFISEGFPILHKGAIKAHGEVYLDQKKKTFVDTEYAKAKSQCIVDRTFVAITLRDLVPSGPSIGLAASLLTGPYDKYLLAQGAYGFRLNHRLVTPEYFVSLSNMPTFRHVLRQNAVGSTQIHIRTPVYLEIGLPLPPIGLQQKFSASIRHLESIKTKARASAEEFEKLFASLQHSAFRGEL
ncbi:restriction endonuclease subunit S [Paraburkholderia youngii]|uniref:restriction endonuclease subunit S n=1 Tax=Paraburkholderia youngii TaxID=2782701 RepID=UPI0021A82BD2|nr:restriction endonuclease subunit S [Paraburkholderia youngii]